MRRMGVGAMCFKEPGGSSGGLRAMARGVMPRSLLIGTIILAASGLMTSTASAGVTTVTLAGSGSGAVTSEPNGIACSNVPNAPQTECSKDWGFLFDNAGLTAKPGPGSSFVGWSGNAGGTCSGAENPCITQLLFLDFTAIATFEPTPAAPAVSVGQVTEAFFPSAIITGTVNPGSLVFPITACYVEYGLTTEYGERSPCLPRNIGPGEDPVEVSATIGVLEPGMSYHYRLVAANGGGTRRGPDRTFVSGTAAEDSCPNADIRAQQGALAQRLPDCRAYEMVSPPFTSGQSVSVSAGSANGSDAMLSSVGGFADTEALPLLGGRYLAERSDSGWSTSATALPASAFPYSGTSTSVDWTRDGKRVLAFANLRADEGTTRYTPVVRDANGTIQIAGPTQDDSQNPKGASEDLRTIVQSSTTRLPLTDGTIDTRLSSQQSLYVSRQEADGQISVSQLAHRAGETMFPNCQVELGGVGPSGGSLFGRNTVSQNGQKIFFTTGSTGTCAGAAARRVWAKVGGADPIDLSASQCPDTCGTAAAAQFRGASRNGSRVYFATTQRLIPGDQDASGQNDLYEYDFNATGQKLKPVTSSTASAGANVAASSLFRVSQDGAYVYFVASGRPLTTTPNGRGQLPQSGGINLYVYHRPTTDEAGVTQFIGALSSLNEQRIQLSSDGRYSLFETTSSLTGEKIAGDAYTDLYRYDAQEDQLLRVWTDASAHNGANRSAPPILSDSAATTGAVPSGASAASSSGGGFGNRQLSDDGSLVGFTTAEPLSPYDRNDSEDAYLWEAESGQLTMLTDGTSQPRSRWNGSSFQGMTPSGDSLFVVSASPLVKAHESGQRAAYAIRRGGGFLDAPQAPEPCVGDVCQGARSAALPVPVVGSVTFAGDGNLAPSMGGRMSGVVVSRVKSVRGVAARLRVRVPAAGRVVVAGSQIRPVRRFASRAGIVRVPVALKSRARKALRKRGTLKVRARVVFRSRDGRSASKAIAVSFKQSIRKHAKSMKGGR